MQQLEKIRTIETAGLVTHRTNPSFIHKLNEEGETVKFCYQCGACTSVCPISKFIGAYKPNVIMQLAKLGIRGVPGSNAFLFCSACELCTRGCPQGVKIHEVMDSLKNALAGDPDILDTLGFDGVLDSLAASMPFPVSYSWICMRPSEEDALGAAILKSFDRILSRPLPEKIEPAANAKKVAIIGSGPAGLTIAWALAKAGAVVTVYEALPELGGMLRTGIPEYRLPKRILDGEIGRIKALGVEMKINTPVDKALFEELVRSMDNVFIATGAYASRRLRIDGADLPGVIPAIELLREYNINGGADIGKKVVVIGGGNVATDAAGAALRCGAESVKLFCLEERDDMPAHPWEVREIEDDGVEVNPSWGPNAILGDDRVAGIKFVKCKSVFDNDGKFNPVFDEKTTKTVEADTVITAIGQAPDLGFLSKSVETERGTVVVDPYTQRTNLSGVFAGGDAALGAGSLIEAILAGRTAAKSITQGVR